MVSDHYGLALQKLRGNLSYFVTPLQYLVDLPGKLITSLRVHYTTHTALLESSQQLQESQLVLRARSQKIWALEQENRQLRTLLHALPQYNETLLTAQVLGVKPNAYQHELLLNQGKKQNVYVGQPVLDTYGLVGQVISVQNNVSHVMMITDTRSAVPVMINRSGLRAILVGNGDLEKLSLIHVPQTADVREGDWLVTSGLDSNYGAGLPVAVVVEVNRDARELFQTVLATPIAAVDKSRHLVLIWQDEKRKMLDKAPVLDTVEKQEPANAPLANLKPLNTSRVN